MQKGQSLVEITIAIGIVLLVLGALTITILIGLKNSQFAQNQLQATKLAQAAMENIKRIRDRNIPICVTEGPPAINSYYWDENDPAKQPTLWEEPGWDGEVRFYLITGSGSPCGLTDDASVEEGESSLDTKFSRYIYITYEEANKINFSAEVSWNDSGGEHKSQLTTILTNY